MLVAGPPSKTNLAVSRRDGRLILAAITLAYVSLGIILGFVQGGVAPVLRTQGMELSALRWVYALYLPFGLAFLWAPVVDSWRWPWLGRRTGWIIPMQWVSALAIVAMAFVEPAMGAWGVLLALGFVATMAAATVDVALDALTVEMLPQAQRAAAAGAKMGGISLGAVLGGGVLVAWYPQLGWHGTLWLIAAAAVLSCLPVLALVSKDRRLSTRVPQHRATLMQTLRKPHMGGRLLRLTLLVCTLLALFNFNRLLLVDMGVSLERIGSILGVIAPLANATACFLAPMLVRAMPVRRAAWLTAGICLASAYLVWLGCLQANTTTVIVGSILTTAGAAALYVVLGSLMLEWASGHQAATDYALLYGVGRFIGTAALMVLPGVIQAVGWPIFLALVMLAFAASAWYFLRLFPKADQGPLVEL
ncbi:MFS transporter [Comamonas testosteroni]|uniref:Major facilitator superfamily MFS_1 n=1 Tax=Comamonas testosteroni (strain DSM 14576 / KF-1) TaxID=399795 RepID=B7WVV8_COMTK|nr:MFS transporter [Comamonas testosteroni]EED67730.1 major facilitator superfamily MFS_1 [Comamonas testosteroni KF-1]WQG65863.1 MFS transporter [Comamonas testosteroni]